MAPPKNTAAVATYGDHEVIMPENKLRKAVSTKPFLPGEEDPVARAEKALAELSTEFASWMESECERLDKARHRRQQRRLHQGQQGSPVPRRPRHQGRSRDLRLSGWWRRPPTACAG